MAGASVLMIPALVMKYEYICWLRTLKHRLLLDRLVFLLLLRPVGCVKQHSMTGTSEHCWWFRLETTKVMKANVLQETFSRATKCQPRS
jgi:hypothetical protein